MKVDRVLQKPAHFEKTCLPCIRHAIKNVEQKTPSRFLISSVPFCPRSSSSSPVNILDFIKNRENITLITHFSYGGTKTLINLGASKFRANIEKLCTYS